MKRKTIFAFVFLLCFSTVSATASTSDLSKLYPLFGFWNFSYFIGSDFFDNNYTLDTLSESTITPGEYGVLGTDDYGDLILATYNDDDSNYNLLDPTTLFNRFYVFDLTDGIAEGTYYMMDLDISSIIGSFSFVGLKLYDIDPENDITTTTTTTSIETTTTTSTTTIPDEAPCPATMILEDEEDIEVLYQYRDEVLAQSPRGQKLIDLYYAIGPALCRILEERPELRERLRIVFRRVIPLLLPARSSSLPFPGTVPGDM